MASMATTSQKKNHTMPGIAYPATDLTLATDPGYPTYHDLFQDLMEGGICVRC
jgi:hypothetical protein